MNARHAMTPALFALCVAGSAQAQDPTHSDGDKYKLVLDNAQVRVLSYTDQPGDKTHLHRHPAFVVVALAPFKRKISLDDGRVMAREFRAGDVLFSQGETHIGENVGSTPTRVILVELKSPKP